MSEQPAPQAPRERWRIPVSVLETGAFVVATVVAVAHHGHFTHTWTVIPTLVGFVAHGVNHPAGGSPV